MKISAISYDDSNPNNINTFSDVRHEIQHRNNTIVYDAESIAQNIILALATPLNSKWFRPGIGSEIDKLLFEPLDDVTARKIESTITTELENYSTTSGVNLYINEVVVTPMPKESYFHVDIKYDVPSINMRDQELEFAIGR